MKPLKEVGQAYMALDEADRQLREGAYEQAAESCRRAMEVSRTVPSGEVFDHAGFDAYCYAGLSMALASLGKFDDALESADKALYYFNRRGELNQDGGGLWITAVFSRAIAFDGVGKSSEALAEFRKASEMLAERKGEMPGREEMQAKVSERIVALQESGKSGKPPGYKAWWEFWS